MMYETLLTLTHYTFYIFGITVLKASLISLGDYIVDKNERKIKKNKLELQLSEKEIDFLVLFSNENRPINRNLVLKKVWKYSEESETHTVETHIHRLRKKILEKFGDTNFIKNNSEGYYIWKKKQEILLLEIYWLQNIENVWLNLKKEKEALKEKKNYFSLAPIFWIIFEDMSVPIWRLSSMIEPFI